MITPINTSSERSKAIKKLMETWKKSPGIMEKAIRVLQMNALPKNKKRKSFLIP